MKKFYEFYSPDLVQLRVGLIENPQNQIVQLCGGQLEDSNIQV